MEYGKWLNGSQFRLKMGNIVRFFDAYDRVVEDKDGNSEFMVLDNVEFESEARFAPIKVVGFEDLRVVG